MILTTANKYSQITIFLVLLLFPNHFVANGQISQPGHPYPTHHASLSSIRIYNLPITEKLKSEALSGNDLNMLKSARSGIMIDVDYNPESSGIWDTLPDGAKVWRAAFHASDVTLMNLVLAPYQLNKGVKVFLYNLSQQIVLGAFTDANNKAINMLGTGYIPDDTLVIEMQVPGFLRSYGMLGIKGVGCDFSGSMKFRMEKDGWYGTSGICNADIYCTDDTLVHLVKNAVTRIVFDGGERCTGTLLNNTLQDGTCYLITAGHCISSEAIANAAVFYFSYESPWCGGPDASTLKSVSGATIRSTGNTLDFTLLELLEPVPFTYRPYFAGWDLSGNPPASGFTIHHPLGDVKKISRENHALSVASYGHGYDENTHFLVKHWELGTTEAGSSGAPFFDNAGRVTGTLTGGQANCLNSINDYFEMISHSWDDYPEMSNQLAYWLDPALKNQGYLDGYDLYREFWLSGDTLSNIQPDESLTNESGNLTWGNYSGHNADYLTGFAEKFTLSEGKKIIGVMLDVAGNYVASPTGRLVLTVWNGDNVPDRAVYEKEVSLFDLAENYQNFIEFDSVIATDPHFFVGYRLQYDVPQDTFSVYMAANRYPEQFNTAFVSDSYQWFSLDDYTGGTIRSSFAIMPVVFDSLPKPVDVADFTDYAIAYPNPARSYVWIEFRETMADPVEIMLYNSEGQLVMTRAYGPWQRLIRIDQLDMASGIYFLRINRGNMTHSLKIALLK